MLGLLALALSISVAHASPIQAREPVVINGLDGVVPIDSSNSLLPYYILFNKSPDTDTVATTKVTTSKTTTKTTSSASQAATTGTGPCASGAQPSWTYKALDGDIFGVCTGTNFLNGNLKNVQATTVAGCADACSTTAGCMSASFIKSTQLCYLKGQYTGLIATSDFDSVIMLSAGASASASVTSVKVTTTSTAFSHISTTTSLSTTKVNITTPSLSTTKIPTTTIKTSITTPSLSTTKLPSTTIKASVTTPSLSTTKLSTTTKATLPTTSGCAAQATVTVTVTAK